MIVLVIMNSFKLIKNNKIINNKIINNMEKYNMFMDICHRQVCHCIESLDFSNPESYNYYEECKNSSDKKSYPQQKKQPA